MANMIDVSTVLSSFGVGALVLAAVVTTYSLTKNKGYEAQREALESWKANAEAKAEELKNERAKNDVLRQEVADARVKIANLEAAVLRLEARPDMAQAINEWRQFEIRDNERIGQLSKSITDSMAASLDKHSVILQDILGLVRVAVEDGSKN